MEKSLHVILVSDKKTDAYFAAHNAAGIGNTKQFRNHNSREVIFSTSEAVAA